MKPHLQVMKFGGTSVGDASCIARVAEIVAKASRLGPLVVVVSAMSGVTNRLIEAATCSETGDRERAAELLEVLREQHLEALKILIRNPETRNLIALGIEELLREAQRLCEGTALIHELTVRTLDSVSSLGERLSAPLVAGALSERGVHSEAIEATGLIVTDSYHGAAEPLMEPTQIRCEACLRPLLQQGIVPVVTGFIGATAEGVLTTLGRGGSDYSATILGGALGADEVIIWTDVC
jgi:aspartokinase/homoserine dehydrogenase 1